MRAARCDSISTTRAPVCTNNARLASASLTGESTPAIAAWSAPGRAFKSRSDQGRAAGDAETHNPATTARNRGVKRRRRAPPVADDRNTPGDLGLEGEARDRYDRLKTPDSPHVTEATEYAFPVVIRRSRPHAAVRKLVLTRVKCFWEVACLA